MRAVRANYDIGSFWNCQSFSIDNTQKREANFYFGMLSKFTTCHHDMLSDQEIWMTCHPIRDDTDTDKRQHGQKLQHVVPMTMS